VEIKMNTQKIGKDADQNALPGAATAIASKRKRGATSAKSGNKGTKNKQDQLVALLSKPNGVRVSVISKRLGWQAHTVRAAISGLRKRGHEVVTSKSPKDGELVYTINANSKENEADAAEASS
jgi:DNA-binding MarR family transcriptional regulator